MSDEDLPSEFCKLFSRTLSLYGVSSNHLNYNASLSYASEYINKELYGMSVLFTGSNVEASQIAGSDIDQMYILPRTYAVTGANEVLHKKDHIFIMEKGDVRHGFSKLKLDTIRKEDEANDDHELQLGRQFLEESLVSSDDGSQYISSDKFNSINLEKMSGTNRYSSWGLATSSIFRHGPCATTEYDRYPQSDLAIGIECEHWPEEAQEWCTRQRPKLRWPSPDMIERLSRLPCYLLPVGDAASKTCPLEWRFAFVPTERELMWELNDTQIQCYLILKLLKKQFLEPLAPDQLSSFFLKTIMFWEIENNVDLWKPPNLLQCISKCLENLKNHVRTLDLPHYVFKKRNLLFSKFSDKEMQIAVMSKIGEIQENIIPSILESASEDGPLQVLNSLWKSCNGSLSALIYNGNAAIPDDPQLLDIADKKKKLRSVNSIFEAIVHLPTTMEKLCDAAEYMKTNEGNFDELIKKTAFSFLAVQIGNCCIPEILQTEDEAKKHDVTDTAKGLFTEGALMDNAAGLLHYATFQYKLGEHLTAMHIIRMIDVAKEKLFYAGISVTRMSLTNDTDTAMYKGPVEITEDTVAYDVIFTADDASWAPDAVRMECALLGDNNNWNYCFFHPLVYAYYLFFQICLERKNVKGQNLAIEELCNFVRTGPSVMDGHRTLNLLGFCCYRRGYYHEAITCFEHSLKIMSSVGNAAVYHLCILCLEVIRKQKRQTHQEEITEEIIYQRVRHK